MHFKLSNFNLSMVKVQLLHDTNSINCDYKIYNAADVDQLIGAELRRLDREHLLAIYLNSRRKVIDIEVVAIGSLSETVVTPREIFKSAILANAHEIILVHNHPSGDQSPTTEDEKMTETMKETGRILNIPLPDHVIIGKGYYSFFEGWY